MSIEQKYIKSLLIRDFQCYERAELDFSSGINVIVGSSDAGKSTIIRALNSVLFNKIDKSYVRHGKEFFSVTVVLNDGSSVTREKGEDVNRYFVIDKNGKKYTHERFREIPKQIYEITSMFPIMIGDEEVNLNLTGQWDGIFGLSMSGTMLSKLFGKITFGIDILDRAIQSIDNDNRKTLARERELNERIVTLSNRKKELTQNYDTITQLKENVVEEFKSYKQFVELLDRSKQLGGELKRLEDEIHNCNLIIGNDKKVKKLSTEFEKYSKIIIKAQQVKEIEDKLEEMHDVLNLQKQVDKLLTGIDYCDKVLGISEKLRDVSSNLNNFYVTKNELEKDIDKVIKDFEEKLREMKICPTCGQKMSEDICKKILNTN